MSNAASSSGESAEPAHPHQTPVICIRPNGQTSHTADSFKSKQTPLPILNPKSEAPCVASPSPSAHSSTVNALAATTAGSHNPPSTHGGAVNRSSSCALPLSSTPSALAPVTPPPALLDAQGAHSPATAPATQAATAQSPTTWGKDACTALPAAAQLYLGPTAVATVRNDLSAAAAAPRNGASNLVTDYLSTSSSSSGFSPGNNSSPHHLLPTGFAVHVAEAPMGAEELTKVAAGKQSAVSEQLLSSAAQLQTSPHDSDPLALQGPCRPAHGVAGAQVHPSSSARDNEPQIPSQKDPTSTLSTTEHDASYTSGLASRMRAVDTSTTEGGDVMGSFHGTAEAGTDSPNMPRLRTRMHTEQQGPGTGEGRLSDAISGAVLGKDVMNANPCTIDFSVSGVGGGGNNGNTVNGASMTLGRSISSHFSAPRGHGTGSSTPPPHLAGDEDKCKLAAACCRSDWAAPRQSSSASFNCTSSSAGAAAEPVNTPTRITTSSTGAAAVDNPRESPSLWQHDESLEGTFEALVSTLRTTPSTANATPGDVEPVSLQEAQRTPAGQQMKQPLLQTLGFSLRDSSGGGASTSTQSKRRAAKSDAATTLSIASSGAAAAMSAGDAQPHSPMLDLNNNTGARPPPTSTAARDTCEAGGKESSGEELAQTTDTGTEDRSQMQFSGDCSAPDPCKSAILTPSPLQPIDATNRNGLENLTGPPDGDRAAGGVGSPTARRSPVADDHASFRSSNSGLSSLLEKSSVEEGEKNFGRASAAATGHDARVDALRGADLVSSRCVGSLAARSDVQPSPAVGVLKDKTFTAHRLSGTSAPDTQAVLPSFNIVPEQDSGFRSFPHSQSPGYSATGSNDENGQSVHGAAAATHPPGADATVTAVRLQPIRRMKYGEAPDPLMEAYSIDPLPRKDASGSTAAAGAGGGAGSRNSSGSGVFCSSLPLSAQRQTYRDAVTWAPAANSATRPPLSESYVHEKGGARAGLARRPDNVTANGDCAGSTSSCTFSDGLLANSTVTTVASGSWSLLGSAEQQPQRPCPVVMVGAVAEDDDMWGAPISSAPAPAAQSPAEATVRAPVRHVTFASPATTHFVEPLPLPWVDSDYFLPNYAYMEYKDSEEGSPSEQQQQQQVADVPMVDEEEAEVLQSVLPFRFRHRNARAQASSQLSGVAVHLRAPVWETWSRGSDSMRSKTSAVSTGEDARTESCATHAQQQVEAVVPMPSHGSGEEAEARHAAAERAQGVFFTKERLASRAALMRSRRAGVQAAGSTSGPALRIHLNPPSVATANTISLALPDFAAPVMSTSAATWHKSKVAQTRSPPTSDDNKDAARGVDDDGGFGGSIQQQKHAAPARPLAETAASPIASQPLTRELCAQLLASLERGSAPVTQSTASFALDTECVVDVLRDIFGDTAAVSDSLHGEPLLPAAPPVPISADGASPVDLLVPGESLSTVERILEALSFTSLTSRASGASLTSSCAMEASVSSGPHSGEQSFAASAGVAAAVLNDGYVVPWRMHATAAGVTHLTGASASTDGKGPVQAVDGTVAGVSAEMAALQEGDFKDGADASVHLTRQRLFPLSAHDASPRRRGTAALSVASFLGTRRLPDAPTAAQWTERDVLVAVLQEQRSMALEYGGVSETERLEDVLRTACS
ncbi:hypothetical protein LMJF_35_0810 [Leishmania major strain Friedlin]|uniref:Uncharacterized protein n=1 Tax=Leishmania major TaxID=5664 RepID=E9AEQ6_LEIMA|nr:hypothetical protein LMJF_35_0810 [Leishmania major strain Friedlin]CAG9582432.1 hypothetical_protein_-_conserved [Leishmania major strain Friedlin]CBZ12709.1 hypothetical protein LMJF_35_0810 [Leishmania major strain Friedlin]|eukprot:XP_003722476.1 hypothetical protein LMJF_35_0810 [Leishmania major strain Friedlin]